MKSILQNLDALIKNGKSKEATHLLKEICKKKVPREYVVPIASMARRLYLPSVGLRLLNPIVRPPETQTISRSTPLERIEYAYCLFNLGARQEAQDVLHTVNKSEHPEVLLIETFILTSTWSFKETIPLLEEYTQSKDISDYQRLVGQVNLASSYVGEEMLEYSTPLIEKLLNTTKNQNLDLAIGRVLSLKGQNLILQKEWNEAQTTLLQANVKLRQTKGVDLLINEKWQAFAKIKQSGTKFIPELNSVRVKASELNRAETVRHCDFLLALVTGNSELAQYLYYGTPYLSFKEKVLKNFPLCFKNADSYYLHLGPKNSEKQIPLKMLLGKEGKKKSKFKVGLAIHRALKALSSDFYRPLSLPALYAALYPGEYYNPVSASARVHHIIKKLRMAINFEKIDLIVKENKASYSLSSKNGAILEIPNQTESGSREEYFLTQLKNRWPDTTFSAKEAGELLNINFSTARKILTKAKAEGRVHVFGNARFTRYGFLVEDSKIAA